MTNKPDISEDEAKKIALSLDELEKVSGGVHQTPNQFADQYCRQNGGYSKERWNAAWNFAWNRQWTFNNKKR